eukprot:678617-Amphidinium_carterae.1
MDHFQQEGWPPVTSHHTTKIAKRHLECCSKVLTSKLVPKNSARTNLYSLEDGFPRSVTVGLT